MTRPPAFSQFLSEVGPAPGPFDLLGVEPSLASDETVSNALKQRLDRLAAHPLGAGPEADEVRVALHVAAAQLRDPAVRAALIEERRLATARADVSPPAPIAELADDFRARAMAAIASAGGWNRLALERVAAVALEHGLEPRRALGMLRGNPRHPSPAPAREASLPAPAVHPRARRRWPALFLMTLLVCSTVLLAERLLSMQRAFTKQAEAPAIEATAEPAKEKFDAPPVSSAAPEQGPALKPVITPSRVDASKAVPAQPAAAPSARSESLERWLERARTLLASPTTTMDSDERLARAVQIARLNLAARLLWNGDSDGSARALASAESAPSTTTRAESTTEAGHALTFLTGPGPEDDGALALELLDLRRQPGASLESFKHRRFNQSPLGPADCDVVADTALFGSPNELRLIARKIVGEQAENPAMVHALLAAMPRASRQATLSGLIAEVARRPLPPVDAEVWPSRARAALHERLTELAAAQVLPEIDALAEMLGEAYAGRHTTVVDPPLGAARHAPEIETPGERPRPSLTSDEPEAAITAYWTSLLKEAEVLRSRREGDEKVGAILRRREARLQLAQGPPQRFAATQAALVELLAALTSASIPSADAESIADRARLARRSATTVFQQIEASERALAELWSVRLTGLPLEGALPQ